MKEHTARNLMELFLKTNDLNQIVSEAALVLKNPLLICDTSYHFVAYSSIANVKDKSWCKGIKRGSWTYEWVSMLTQLNLDYSGERRKIEVLTDISELSAARRIIGTLCVEGSHLGYYLILEEETPFSQVEQETYRQVELVLSKCMYLERPLLMSGRSARGESIVLDLLQKRFDNEQIFQKRAAKMFAGGEYRLYCIDLKEYYADGSMTRSGISAKINDIRSFIGQCMPLSWHVPFENQIVVLADLTSKFYENRTAIQNFENFLKENDLLAGQSDRFSNLYDLRTYYEQATSALELGTVFQDERTVIPYEDYKIFRLFQNAEETNLFQQYSTEEIRKVCRYDEENGTGYFETIYHYLGSNQSLKKTAQKLYLHRNTVTYRIERIKELFRISFDDDYKNYMNYTSCLIYRYCKNLEKKKKG